MRLIDADAFEVFSYSKDEMWSDTFDAGVQMVLEKIDQAPTIEAVPVQKWIPIKTRPMDDDEREYYSEHFGYDIEYEEAIMFDCEMPKDGQTVWVCYKDGNIAQDVCENDDGMIGLEGNGDWDYIVAWMPIDRPEPYKMDGKEQGDGRN